MGDRGNIFFVDHEIDSETYGGLYLYSHWAGSGMWLMCKEGLKRGKSRWGDSQYLARILFCDVVRDILDETTGAGLSTFMGDNEHQIIRVNDLKYEVSFHDPGKERLQSDAGNSKWSYEEYITEDNVFLSEEFLGEPERF